MVADVRPWTALTIHALNEWLIMVVKAVRLLGPSGSARFAIEVKLRQQMQTIEPGRQVRKVHFNHQQTSPRVISFVSKWLNLDF